ncbi:MAG: hypothetical protein JWN39_2991, partial [Ilumatobacteraceae bacterium]|nr:hypothetical protein [Ilumatobacteraceae bacterium]
MLVTLAACSSDPQTSPASAPVGSTVVTTLASPTTADDPTTAPTVPEMTPATTAAAPVSGFAQHIDADLTLPDSTTVHFSGDVQLNSGVIAEETGLADQEYLEMFPKATGSFTNTSDAALPLATARV